MTTPISSIILVLIASVIGSLAMAALKSGADHMRVSRKAAGYRIAGGIALFLASSVLYVMGIRKGSLTVLYPMVSLGYVWAMLWGRLFFHERLNRNKVIGLCLVVAGVVFIGMGRG